MSILSFLQRRQFDPVSFERQLEKLHKRISSNERKLARLPFQQGSLRRIVRFYGGAVYVMLLSWCCYTSGCDWRLVSSLQWAVLSGLPVMTVILMRLITAGYAMRTRGLEKEVERLRLDHGTKIDELKEQTKFSRTQALLTRFADGGDLKNELDEEIEIKKRELDELKKISEQQQDNKGAKSDHKRWFDTIVNSVAGDEALGPQNRFALICANCLNHNGLAPVGMLGSSVKYRCPVCGFMNGLDETAGDGTQIDETNVNESKNDKSKVDETEDTDPPKI